MCKDRPWSGSMQWRPAESPNLGDCGLQRSGVKFLFATSSLSSTLFRSRTHSRSLSCPSPSLSYRSSKRQLVPPVSAALAVTINTTKGRGNGIALLHDSLRHRIFQNTAMPSSSHCPLIGIIVDKQTNNNQTRRDFLLLNHLKVCSSTSHTIVNELVRCSIRIS
jgi:hypothetical protein